MRALHNLNGQEKQQMLLEIFPWIFLVPSAFSMMHLFLAIGISAFILLENIEAIGIFKPLMLIKCKGLI